MSDNQHPKTDKCFPPNYALFEPRSCANCFHLQRKPLPLTRFTDQEYECDFYAIAYSSRDAAYHGACSSFWKKREPALDSDGDESL